MPRYDEEEYDEDNISNEDQDLYIDTEGVDEQLEEEENYQENDVPEGEGEGEGEDEGEKEYEYTPEEIKPNKKVVIYGLGNTSKKMNKFETTRTIGVIASFIEFPEFFVPNDVLKESKSTDEVFIAKKWVDTTSANLRLPVNIVRTDGNKQYIISPETLISLENSYSYSGKYPM